MWLSKSKRVARCCFAICLFTLPCIQAGQGQPLGTASGANPSNQSQKVSSDSLGRTTPRGTVRGFLSAAYNQKFDTAAQYLDTRAGGSDASLLARQLFFVLDRKLPAKLNNINNDPLGSMSDPVDSRRELIGTVVTEDGGVDIYLERVDRPNAASIWLFSRQTLVDIPNVYHKINATPVDSRLPEYMLKRYFSITLFAWLYFLVFLPLLYLTLSVLNQVVSAGLHYALQRWILHKTVEKLNVLPHPLRLLIVSGTIIATVRAVGWSLVSRQAGSTIADLVLIAAIVWAVFMVNARCEAWLKRRMERQGRLSTTAVLRPARRVMDLISIIVGMICVLNILGINPTAALAGLGVGGIAIALAAQKTLENVIGGVSLIIDDAVRVGDLFRIGQVEGFIEVIGLRSTRVRTHERTIVIIPNAQMATMTLENLSARDRFWLHHLINIEYGTSPSALESLLSNVRGFLEQDARVFPEMRRVRILRFAESRLELEVWAYVSARNWPHFLQIQEDLLITIRQLIASCGVALAHPSRTVYVKSGPETDGAATHVSGAEKEADHEMQVG